MMGSYLFLLLILACPLMMIFMMRGMHGRHGGDANQGRAQGHAGGHAPGPNASSASLDELRVQRERLDREIEERESERTDTGRWRVPMQDDGSSGGDPHGDEHRPR